MAKVYYDKEKNIIAFHPGYYVDDIISESDIKEILIKGLGEETLNKLINGEIDVDRELAKNLEICTGINKLTWLKLQESYNDKSGCTKCKEYTFLKEYKASFKDMLIIITLITLCMFPILIAPVIIAFIIAPFYLHAELTTKVIYYLVVMFVMPLVLMLIRRLKDVFKNTIKFMIGKLS